MLGLPKVFPMGGQHLVRPHPDYYFNSLFLGIYGY